MELSTSISISIIQATKGTYHSAPVPLPGPIKLQLQSKLQDSFFIFMFSVNKTRVKVLLDIFCRGTMEQALFLIQNITLGTIIHYRDTGYYTKNTLRDNIKWVDITFHIRFQIPGAAVAEVR